MTTIAIKRLDPDLTVPFYATPEAAGLDLPARHDATLGPGCRLRVATGIAVQLAPGHVGLICPRSGLALKRGLTVLNAPGIIDSDFVGELGVILINLGAQTEFIKRGDRIAQLLVMPAVYGHHRIEIVDELYETERGDKGWGSSGS